MNAEPEKLIRFIEKVYDDIYKECQSDLYYEPQVYQESCQHILNAATILYNDAARLFQDNLERSSRSKLTLLDMAMLLQKIFQILLMPDIIIVKEDNVQKVLCEQNLVPERYLISNYWCGDFINRAEI